MRVLGLKLHPFALDWGVVIISLRALACVGMGPLNGIIRQQLNLAFFSFSFLGDATGAVLRPLFQAASQHLFHSRRRLPRERDLDRRSLRRESPVIVAADHALRDMAGDRAGDLAR